MTIEAKPFWAATGPYPESVLSTRIRLARNIPGYPFPGMMDREESLQVLQAVLGQAERISSLGGAKPVYLEELTSGERRIRMEESVITENMDTRAQGGYLHHPGTGATLLVNEEDHIRIQVIRPGFQPMETYALADALDDELNEIIPYAFSPELGYLTACPANLGTGVRVSAIIHLPGHTLRGGYGDLAARCAMRGAELRKLPQGAGNRGSLYLLSFRGRLGHSEHDILESFDNLVLGILSDEDRERDLLMEQFRLQIEDMVWRSYGILAHAREIAFSEALEHLSNIRFGILLAIIPSLPSVLVNELMVTVQPYHLRRDCGAGDDGLFNENQSRAEFIRRAIARGGHHV